MKKKETIPNALTIFVICAGIFAVSGYFYNKNENKRIIQEAIQKRRTQLQNEKKISKQGRIPVFPDDNNNNTQENQEEIEVFPDDNNTNLQNNQQSQIEKQWVNCNKCHGTGLEFCDRCGGSRNQKCHNCSGRGNMGYNGERICTECNGRGLETCSGCGGKGNRGDCNECKGRGQIKM